MQVCRPLLGLSQDKGKAIWHSQYPCAHMTGLPCDLDHPVRMYVAMSGSRELNYNGTKEGCIMLPAVLKCAFGCESTEPVPLAQMNIAYL